MKLSGSLIANQGIGLLIKLDEDFLMEGPRLEDCSLDFLEYRGAPQFVDISLDFPDCFSRTKCLIKTNSFAKLTIRKIIEFSNSYDFSEVTLPFQRVRSFLPNRSQFLMNRLKI